MMCLDDPYNPGWNSDCTVRLNETYFPSDVTQVLVDMNADTGETEDNNYEVTMIIANLIVTLVMMNTLTTDRYF